MRYRWLLLALLGFCCLVTHVSAQGQLINGDRTIVGTLNTCATDTSTGDAYACALVPAITTYIAGSQYSFKAPNANVGTATLSLNGLVAKTIVKVVGGIATTLADNDIRAGQYVNVVYDITADNFQMQSTPGTAPAPAALAANGANCTVAGTFPNGVDASGVAENCVTLSGVNPQTDTYQVLAADFNGYKTITVASGTFTITLVASGSQPASGKYIRVLNYGSGVVTIARSGQNINGGTASLTLPASSALAPTWAYILSDGTNYFAEVADVAAQQVRSIYIPAGNFDVNGGCAVGAAAVLLAGGPKTVSITCTDSIADSLETMFTMPDGWNAGTFTVELTAFNVGTNASTLVYEISWIAKCVGPDEAPGTWAAVNHNTDAATSLSLTTTDNLLYHATSGAITPVGGCAAGDTVFLKGEIDASATAMTPMTDLKILGAKIEYTRSGND